MILPIGAMVTVEARGSRSSNGETRIIPAIVTQQYLDAPGQPVDLYAIHFEGFPFRISAVPSDSVQLVEQPVIRIGA